MGHTPLDGNGAWCVLHVLRSAKAVIDSLVLAAEEANGSVSHEAHLVADIAGREGTEVYNGYTSCPMITKIGRAMLIEFDYKNNLTPSFPGVIAPLEELWISWLMKEIALKPTYNAMLRGKA